MTPTVLRKLDDSLEDDRLKGLIFSVFQVMLVEHVQTEDTFVIKVLST